jgi:hypothetical protein
VPPDEAPWRHHNFIQIVDVFKRATRAKAPKAKERTEHTKAWEPNRWFRLMRSHVSPQRNKISDVIEIVICLPTIGAWAASDRPAGVDPPASAGRRTDGALYACHHHSASICFISRFDLPIIVQEHAQQ